MSLMVSTPRLSSIWCVSIVHFTKFHVYLLLFLVRTKLLSMVFALVGQPASLSLSKELVSWTEFSFRVYPDVTQAWTGAWTWVSSGNAAAFGAIKDPNNNVAIEMHQYLDSDGSGTSATCVDSTIGADRLQVATQWLQQNNLKGFLGEIGAGSNPTCISAVQGALCSMQQSGVWIGALWWAAGPWWGTVSINSSILPGFRCPVLTRGCSTSSPSNLRAVPPSPQFFLRLSSLFFNCNAA